MIQAEYVGVDVAKDKFDVAIRVDNRDKHAVYSNDPKGHAKFAEWLIKNTKSSWVCMEATGHYSEGLADFLTHRGFKVSVVNPYQIKNFAKASLGSVDISFLSIKITQKCQIFVTRSEKTGGVLKHVEDF